MGLSQFKYYTTPQLRNFNDRLGGDVGRYDQIGYRSGRYVIRCRCPSVALKGGKKGDGGESTPLGMHEKRKRDCSAVGDEIFREGCKLDLRRNMNRSREAKGVLTTFNKVFCPKPK